MTQGTTFVLVPGYWLGGWAWDAVAEGLRSRGAVVDAVTLPGLHPGDDPSTVTLQDQIDAVAGAVERLPGRVVLVGHSGAGALVSGAADAVHDRLVALVFVDSGPAPDRQIALPDLPADTASLPLPSWTELEDQGSSLAGLDERALETFRARAVPQPAPPLREPLTLAHEERYAVPVTVICSSYPAQQVREMIETGHPWFEELARFRDVTLTDLPTGHWPMWSRPDDLVVELEAAAERSRPASPSGGDIRDD